MSGINVSAEAQTRLCRFSNLIHQATVLKDKKSFLQKKIQSLDDAEDELALSMQSDDVWVKCGECFVQRSLEDAEEVTAASKIEASAELKKTDEKLQKIETETLDLKAKLYAELGSSVNLDK